jgi:hypothetical protein
MSVQSIFKNLEYTGRADGDRRSYHVLQGHSGYLIVASNNRGGFNVSVVPLEAPDVIARRFGGREVTGSKLAKQSRRPDLFRDAFAPLSALYVMVALGRARKLQKREGRAMVFKIQ